MFRSSLFMLSAFGLTLACNSGGATATTGASASDDSSDEATDGGPACEVSAPQLPSWRIAAQGDRFVDSLGREVWLRGVNTGGRAKFDPYFPFPFAESGRPEQSEDPSFEQALAEYADRVVEWGHNVVRVPFTWEAIEAERGVYDGVFLDRYEAMLDAFGTRGIRVIVDNHQDVYSRYFCGDGFPPWAVADPPAEYPTVEACEFWSNGYFANAGVNANFDRFWANEDQLREDFVAMWQELVSRTAERDFVVGYEIINEPHFGSEAEADWVTGTLPDFYEDTVDALRELAPEALWFFGLGALDGVDSATQLRALTGAGWAFAPHYYDQAVFLGGPDMTDADALEGIGPWAQQGLEWQRPVLVGEFGVKTSYAGSPAWIAENFDALDASLLSGTVWEYSATMDDWNDEGFGLVGYGGAETPSVEAIVRVYPAAVAGRVSRFVFDGAAKRAELEWQAEAGISELVLPERLVDGGVELTLEGVEGCWAHDPQAQRVYLRTLDAGDARVVITFD